MAAKKKKVNAVGPAECYRSPKSVRITEAENGLTVSCYGDKGEEIMVAKSPGEAMRHAKKMLGHGSTPAPSRAAAPSRTAKRKK